MAQLHKDITFLGTSVSWTSPVVLLALRPFSLALHAQFCLSLKEPLAGERTSMGQIC